MREQLAESHDRAMTIHAAARTSRSNWPACTFRTAPPCAARSRSAVFVVARQSNTNQTFILLTRK